MEAATRTLDAAPHDAEAEIAQRRCWAAGQLLFRGASEQDDLESSKPGQTAAEVRQRLHRATMGERLGLARDLVAAVRAELPVPDPPPHPDPSAPIPLARLSAAAAKGQSGSLRGARDLLTGGPPAPPGPDTDSKVVALFRTDAPESAERNALADAIAAARALPPRQLPHVRPRLASQRCAQLSAPAGPGPSGWRNSYIIALHSHPQGPRVLAEWAQQWGHGRVAPWVAALWSGALTRPFFKANGVSVRPVLCSEALVKFATGTVVAAADKELHRAMGLRQFGGGRAGGAALEVDQVRAAAGRYPNRGLSALDVQTAFGDVSWLDALTVYISTHQ